VEWLVVSVQALDREVGAVLAVLSEKAPGEGVKDSGFPRCVGSCDRCAVAEVDGLICCSFEVQDLQLFDFYSHCFLGVSQKKLPSSGYPPGISWISLGLMNVPFSMLFLKCWADLSFLCWILVVEQDCPIVVIESAKIARICFDFMVS
jgi:hypothetical protein